jgi:hypothetical protein
VKVSVDGTPAGIAPAFPYVVADLNWLLPNSANKPITTPEMLNFKPFRVDLTPFAGVLSTPGTHTVTADDNLGNGGASLLLYLDPGAIGVTGAVTLNTLATQSGAPTTTNTLQQNGGAITGNITTNQQRDFEIRGFVITSEGRIDSVVHQTSQFSNTQAFDLNSVPLVYNTSSNELYDQNIWLTSTVQQTSIRRLGSYVLSWDRTRVRYLLHLTYHTFAQIIDYGDSEGDVPFCDKVQVTQQEVVDGDHYLPALGHYMTHMQSAFSSLRTGGQNISNPVWESTTSRDYKDNLGSCYRAGMASSHGSITALSTGQGCPGNQNQVAWYAHPDGAPGSSWWP